MAASALENRIGLDRLTGCIHELPFSNLLHLQAAILRQTTLDRPQGPGDKEKRRSQKYELYTLQF